MASEVIAFDQIPTQSSWRLEPIYKANQRATGVLVWSISFDSTTSRLTIEHGTRGGALLPDTVLIKTNQSGRTIQKQALLEARARYLKKSRAGYTTNPTGEVSIFKPQLANQWAFEGKHHNPRALSDKHFAEGRVMCQHKLNGIRLISSLDESGDVCLKTRNGLEVYWLNHIRFQLFLFFKYLPTGAVIDGEMMHRDGVSLQVLNSIIRSQEQEHPQNGEITYNVFDVALTAVEPVDATRATLDVRTGILDTAFAGYQRDAGYTQGIILRIPQVPVPSIEVLRTLYYEALGLGKEGLVVRFLVGANKSAAALKQSQYTHSRNNNLLKIKDHEDAEGEVVGVDSGSGKDEGTAVFLLRMDTPAGPVEFSCRPRGTLEERRYWFEHPEECIGQQYTFSFRTISDTGVPQQPTGVGFRFDL